MRDGTELDLPALDGQNPLGFFAALGLLRVIDDHCAASGLERPALGFTAAFTAQLRTTLTYEQVREVVIADAVAQAASVPLRLAYRDGARCEPEDEGAERDLKPTPEVARQLLLDAARSGRRDADLAAAFFSELVQDNNGNSKPTALHFTAGQQAFLSMVDGIRRGVNPSAVDEALLGPWRTAAPLPSLSWDASVARQYALRASDPSKEKRGSVVAANWLGVQGLTFLPVLPRGGRLVTSGVRGGWKDSVLTWPLWSCAATRDTLASLLRLDARRWTQEQRASANLLGIFSCGIVRSDQGGYGSFTPAEVVLPRR